MDLDEDMHMIWHHLQSYQEAPDTRRNELASDRLEPWVHPTGEH
ncbi:MAG TPA: hypothetical protein VLV17_04605 [Anaeromyxobacteraceae bacterium]|nr:hypothetical protein [Anaeromyxobacteraceae bacterium]